MEQYIKKSVLVAEIEKKLTDILTCKKDASTPEERIALTNMLRLCKEILSFINTLEVKEVEKMDINKVCRFLDGYSFIPTYVINELRNEFSKGE